MEELRDAIREIKAQTYKPFGVDLLLPKSVAAPGGDVKELPLSEVLKKLPEPHREWIRKVRAEMGLSDVDVMIKLNSTTNRPSNPSQVCIVGTGPAFLRWSRKSRLDGGRSSFSRNEGARIMGIFEMLAAWLNQAWISLWPRDMKGQDGWRIGTMALLPQAIDAAAPGPVLAAGGIGDGRGPRRLIGHAGHRRLDWHAFLATDEGGALDANKQRVPNSN